MKMGKMIGVAACFFLAACNAGEKAKSAAKPPVAVEAAAASAADLVEGVEVTGSLEPKFWADVRTQIPGLVKKVFVSEWVRVKKGTPLAAIDIAETEALVKRAEAGVESARAGEKQAQVSLNRSEREQARLQKLKDAGLATQLAMDDARTETEAARSKIEAARAQVRVAEEELRQARARLAKGVVTAPLDGVVALRDVNVGDLASDAAAGKPIFRIVDSRLLNLTVNVPSVDSARVRIGQRLEFSVDSLPGKSFSGRVMYVNPELSAADRSLKVIAEVRNDGELLKGGLFAKGRIVTGSRRGGIQVPRSAVAGLDLSAGSGFLFVLEGDVARKRSVRTGSSSGEMLEIVSGLKSGESFVVRGGFNLKDGDRVSLSGGATTAPPAGQKGGER